MKCSVCGKENAVGNVFCTSCGAKLILKMLNPTKVQEIVLRVVNFILSVPFCTAMVCFFGSMFFGSFIVGIGNSTESDMSTEAFVQELFGPVILFLGITIFIVLAFNIIMGITMYKKNKQNSFAGKYKPVKKVVYLVAVYFLGVYGVHRFIIGDNKGGVIRLVIIIGSIFLLLMGNLIGLGLAVLGIIFNYSLAISDFVIGLSKVSDEHGLITL